ncbi:DNA polymerase III, alpha subunit [Desulfovibrio sp. X2]|uniref:DNA polymerase III subunit alpha n=1 Tax=Desulfovibrio sp. X2 TaxID=941449 RepID=UPI000358971A|nr:DNA polymerase III subunit alpha [Desulfovibrio sp. X2]EPR43895.1 DNA polymerase III, alpha subunit [Desulfovibrio sp. X2]
MSTFVHLHCHTEYSLLDGAIRIGDLCARAIDYGMPSCAITDHGNMHGALDYYMQAKKYGLKPILGCEVYVANGSRTEKKAASQREAGYHLVLLSQNMTGYKNLLQLVTRGHLEGFHYKPRVDHELLAQYNEGLIALSACLAGEIPRAIISGGMDEARRLAELYSSHFPGRFYLELQSNGIEEQHRVNEKLLELSEELSLPLVATNDCHYLNADDVEAHDVLLCIQTAAQVDDPKRMRFGTDDLYFRSPEEMEKEFSHCPEAIANTLRIAEQCEVELDLKTLHFPVYDLPEGMTLETEFRKLAKEGLERRLKHIPEEKHPDYWKRLEYELDVICTMQFPAYFLIVQDFINWAKDHGIPVGPGRGSAAGSIVAYALRITNLDPLPYNLLFERFLNVERVSMPDIDVDFCERRRLEVIRDYVSKKYGADSVAQITTFGKMKAKAVVRDVARAMGFAFGEADKVAKLIPEEMKMTITKALDKEPELKTLYDTDGRVKKLLDISKRLEGLCRHASVHAAGVVISDKPMVEYLPLYTGKNGEIVTQFDMKKVEKVGLVKFDFLGLRTMTVIQDCLDNIARQGKTAPDLDTLPLTDEKTYELYSRGDTDGVFQVESQGMRKYLMKLKPNCFEDLIAMLALYRPGPLGSGMVDEFIDRKHGRVPVSYPYPTLEETLKPTYGVIVYQEQVMKTAQVIGNYSLGEGDLLRRAMGKKIAEEMASQRERFLMGSRENNIPDSTANEIFDLMEKFAEYGFNKSHSAAYALISYHTAWLKTYYPHEFMAALMTSEIEDQDKILKHINTCRDNDIRVFGPDINKSIYAFSVEAGSEENGGAKAVRYGLGGIKNVGQEAIRDIIENRENDGPYTSLLDLCSRVNLRKTTKRVLEHLIKAGAFDCFGITRAALFAGMERVHAQGQKKQKEKDSGQMSLMGLLDEKPACLPGLGLSCEEQTMEEWPDDEKLRFEKDALGLYLSSHPLLAWRHELRRLRLPSIADCAEMGAETEVDVAVVISSKQEKYTKKGDKMAICQVEDLTGSCEMLVFPRAFEAMRELLDTDQPLVVSVKIAPTEEASEDAPKKAKLFAEKAQPLSKAQAAAADPVVFRVEICVGREEALDGLRDILTRHPGGAPVYVDLKLPEAYCRLQLDARYSVSPCPEFYKELDAWRGSLSPATAG